MAKTYRPIVSKREMAIQIGIGLFLALICAGFVSFFAPFLFQWVAGFFDPAPNAPPDCEFLGFMEEPLAKYQACKGQSNSFPNRMDRLSDKIPWFWIAFIGLGWAFNRNPLKGRIRDDSDDLTYPGEMGWHMVMQIIVPIFILVLIWAILVRDKTSFIALGIAVVVVILWTALHKWFLKKFGRRKSDTR